MPDLLFRVLGFYNFDNRQAQPHQAKTHRSGGNGETRSDLQRHQWVSKRLSSLLSLLSLSALAALINTVFSSDIFLLTGSYYLRVTAWWYEYQRPCKKFSATSASNGKCWTALYYLKRSLADQCTIRILAFNFGHILKK